MNKILGFIAALVTFPLLSFGFSGATNQVWSAPDITGTNYVAEITANGNLKVSGLITSVATQFTPTAASATIGSLTVQTNATVTGTATVGAASTTGTVTAVKFVSTAALGTAATNATPTGSITIMVNGTNYLIKLFPN